MKRLTLLLITGILSLNFNLAFSQDDGESLCGEQRDGTPKTTTVTTDVEVDGAEVFSTSSAEDTTEDAD